MPTNLSMQGYGYRVSLKAKQPSVFTFTTKRGAARFKFAGTEGTKTANVVMNYGGQSTSGPATSVRSIETDSTGPQSASLTASADTDVDVFFYDAPHAPPPKPSRR